MIISELFPLRQLAESYEKTIRGCWGPELPTLPGSLPIFFETTWQNGFTLRSQVRARMKHKVRLQWKRLQRTENLLPANWKKTTFSLKWRLPWLSWQCIMFFLCDLSRLFEFFPFQQIVFLIFYCSKNQNLCCWTPRLPQYDPRIIQYGPRITKDDPRTQNDTRGSRWPRMTQCLPQDDPRCI